MMTKLYDSIILCRLRPNSDLKQIKKSRIGRKFAFRVDKKPSNGVCDDIFRKSSRICIGMCCSRA